MNVIKFMSNFSYILQWFCLLDQISFRDVSFRNFFRFRKNTANLLWTHSITCLICRIFSHTSFKYSCWFKGKLLNYIHTYKVLLSVFTSNEDIIYTWLQQFSDRIQTFNLQEIFAVEFKKLNKRRNLEIIHAITFFSL